MKKRKFRSKKDYKAIRKQYQEMAKGKAKPKKKKEKAYDADINKDGKVDEKDVEIVKKSIRKKNKK